MNIGNWKLVTKTVLAVVLCVFIGQLTAVLFSYQFAKKASIDIVHDDFKVLASQRVGDIENYIQDLKRDLAYWARLPELQNFSSQEDKVEASKHLKAISDDYGIFESVFLIGKDGIVRAGSRYSAVDNMDLSDRDYFQETLNRPNAYFISKVLVSKISKEAIFVVAKSISDPDTGEYKALLLVSVKMEEIEEKYVNSLKLGDNAYAYMMDQNGLLIIHPNKEAVLHENLAKQGIPFAQQIIETKRGITEYYRNGEKRVVAFDQCPITGWIFVVGASSRDLLSEVLIMRKMLVFVAVFSILITGVFVYIMIARIAVKPINDISHKLEDIAQGEGDLRNRLLIKNNDEIGVLSKWFNVFVERLQLMIKELSNDVSVLKDSAQDLSGFAVELTQGSEDTSSLSVTVAAAAEEMSSNIRSVSTATEQSFNNINMIAAAIEELSSTINEITQNTTQADTMTEQAVGRIKDTSRKVNNLGDSADEISKVITMISDISDQVNLLALNATIEAARAGEAGRGFAVVANEIKGLAIQTAEASAEIQLKASTIQENTKVIVGDINDIADGSREVSDIVGMIAASMEEQLIVIGDISSNIVQVSSGISEINENIGQASLVVNSVTEDIHKVSEASVTGLQRSKEVNSSSDTLNELSLKLQSVVSRFKV